MSFSIVDSKVKNYTRPIYDFIIQDQAKCQVQPIQDQTQVQPLKVQSQPLVQEQKVQSENVVQNSQPFILEKRKPFQLKSRERFQARRSMAPPQRETVISQPLPVTETQTHSQTFENQVESQPLPQVPLVQLPALNTPPPTDSFDEFGYSIDDI